MENTSRFFEADRFAEHVGVELLDVSSGRARARLNIKEQHLNSFNTAHGGAIFALADSAFAAAANSHGTMAMAISVNISYLKAVSQGTLIAEAKEISLSARLGTYTVDVTDDNGEAIATFHGMVYRRKNRQLSSSEMGSEG